MANTVQSIGSFQAFISHPLVNAGVKQQIRGLKLDSSFFDANPEMENSKRIALIGGGPGAVDTAALTTTVQFGELTLNVIRVATGNVTFSGGNASATTVPADLIRFCLAWQLIPDSTGATLDISYAINGGTENWQFQACTLGKVPPLKLSGNDLPEYAINLKYGSFTISNS